MMATTLVFGESNSINGEVCISSDEQENSVLCFGGKEVLLEEPELQELKDREDWPESYTVYENNEIKLERENAYPHCAAIFIYDCLDNNGKSDNR